MTKNEILKGIERAKYYREKTGNIKLWNEEIRFLKEELNKIGHFK